MENLIIGDKAPDFEVANQNNELLKLSSFKGTKVILYFYPKDNTSGCTAEACSLRDGYETLKSRGYEVIGVSPDSPKSHTNFIEKQSLPFNLIADTEKEVCQKYGVWVEKKMYGKTYMGVKRTTFVIDENGDIAHIVEKVDTKNHAEQLLKIIEQ